MSGEYDKMNSYRGDVGTYDDIINLSHHMSKTHPHMPLSDRAAQFSPFAALTGHNEAIKETARLTHRRINLDEDAKTELDYKLCILSEQLDKHWDVTITYFQPDKVKDGGSYEHITGVIDKINKYNHSIVFEDGKSVNIEDIVEMDSDIFYRYM